MKLHPPFPLMSYMPPWVSNVVQVGRLANFAIVGFIIALTIATGSTANGQTLDSRGAETPTNAQQSATTPHPSWMTPGATYAWPTTASTYLTSTFAETRSAHLHSAIDISTRAEEGHPVLAARDGVVSRIMMSPFGYGNALMLTHEDGSHTLYAHLSHFTEEIQALGDRMRMPSLQTDLDYYPPPQRQIRVSKGERIGFSGSTGVGPPHLHFEVRSPGGVPINPLLVPLEAPLRDGLAPVFSSLYAEFLDAELLDAELYDAGNPPAPTRLGDQFLDLRTKDRKMIVVPTQKARLRLSVDVFDQAEGGANVYAVYRLRLMEDGEVLFESRADSFTFGQTADMVADRHHGLLRSGYGGYQRLHVLPSNRFEMYPTTLGADDLVLDGDHGSHREFTLEAEDFRGNVSRVSVEVLHDSTRQWAEWKNQDKGLDRWRLDSLRAAWLDSMPSSLVEHMTVDTVLQGNKRHVIASVDERFVVSIPPDALIEPTRIHFTSFASDSAYHVLMHSAPTGFRHRADVRVYGDNGVADSTVGLAWVGFDPPRGGVTLSPMGVTHAGRALATTTRDFWSLQTIRDVSSPELKTIHMRQHPVIGRTVSFLIKEESPLDLSSVKMRQNDRDVLPIYDFEDDSFTAYHPNLNTKSGDTFTLELKDQHGHHNSFQWVVP
ncbi:MAG: M23 family metallopeptidase [Balneolaceae bacterium]|nr:M23 family metallopeptidase [Balneolaceae bacterium]